MDVGVKKGVAEALSENSVAVWNDGTSRFKSMEQYVVGPRELGCLLILASTGRESAHVHAGYCVIEEAAFGADTNLL